MEKNRDDKLTVLQIEVKRSLISFLEQYYQASF